MQSTADVASLFRSVLRGAMMHGCGVAVDPSTVLATNTLDDGCMASPAVFDAAIYLRTKTHLYRLGKRP